MKKLLTAAILVLVVGCSTPGKIKVDAIDDLVTAICDRHDKYVSADSALDPAKKESELRSSALLRKVCAEAKAAESGQTTAPAK